MYDGRRQNSLRRGDLDSAAREVVPVPPVVVAVVLIVVVVEVVVVVTHLTSSAHVLRTTTKTLCRQTVRCPHPSYTHRNTSTTSVNLLPYYE